MSLTWDSPPPPPPKDKSYYAHNYPSPPTTPPKPHPQTSDPAWSGKASPSTPVLKSFSYPQTSLQQAQRRATVVSGVPEWYIPDEEERQRRVAEDKKRAAALRRERLEAEKRLEEERAKALEERKKSEKEKRLRSGKAAQQWLSQHTTHFEAEARARAESRERTMQERRQRRIPTLPGLLDQYFSNWVTVQDDSTSIWRRRFCRVRRTCLQLYRDPVTLDALDTIPFADIVSLYDTPEDLAELECLPGAFAVKRKNGVLLLLLCDSDAAKELLICVIIQLARL
ncbi:hypothetical protein K474DRAFT_1658190 [Panus rudis PR-1116 ss-1]|nr:hypothetical protein K474DRAFT_1658190 [Panus rudis PR-1116 ss-1]